MSAPEQLDDFSEDASILGDAIDALYPSKDRYGQGQVVDKAVSRMIDVAKSTNDAMLFYKSVAAVAVATRDEHIIPFPPEDYRAYRREATMMLPYTVVWRQGRPLLAAVAYPEYESLIGAQIIAFDGLPFEAVRETLVATIPSDGLSESFALRHLQDFTPTQNENYFDLNYPIWFGARETYQLTLAKDDGSSQTTLELDALDWTQFSRFYRERLPRARPVQFRWVDDEIAYLEILSFHDWYYEEHAVEAEVEFSNIFASLTTRNAGTLILDLRRNEGGGDVSSLLLDYLMESRFSEYDAVITKFVGQPDAARHCENANEVAFDPAWAVATEDDLFALKESYYGLITGADERQPNAARFGGKVIVLISGATGSAAAKVAAMLEQRDQVVFIGEETGGAAAGATAYGNCRLRLPRSDIIVDIPLIRFERDVDGQYGRGVLPDILVDVSMVGKEVDQALGTAIRWARDGAD